MQNCNNSIIIYTRDLNKNTGVDLSVLWVEILSLLLFFFEELEDGGEIFAGVARLGHEAIDLESQGAEWSDSP